MHASRANDSHGKHRFVAPVSGSAFRVVQSEEQNVLNR
jgi:hypothetical protein